MEGGELVGLRGAGDMWRRQARAMEGEQAFDTIAHLDPKWIRARIGPKQYDEIDLAVYGSVSEGRDNPNLRPTFEYLDGQRPSGGHSDGVVTQQSAAHGRRTASISKNLDRKYDHVELINDPAVLDEIVRLMNR
jgi:hypothetical protein